MTATLVLFNGRCPFVGYDQRVTPRVLTYKSHPYFIIPSGSIHTRSSPTCLRGHAIGEYTAFMSADSDRRFPETVTLTQKAWPQPAIQAKYMKLVVRIARDMVNTHQVSHMYQASLSRYYTYHSHQLLHQPAVVVIWEQHDETNIHPLSDNTLYVYGVSSVARNPNRIAPYHLHRTCRS
jgi:hypothetical protein